MNTDNTPATIEVLIINPSKNVISFSSCDANSTRGRDLVVSTSTNKVLRAVATIPMMNGITNHRY